MIRFSDNHLLTPAQLATTISCMHINCLLMQYQCFSFQSVEHAPWSCYKWIICIISAFTCACIHFRLLNFSFPNESILSMNQVNKSIRSIPFPRVWMPAKYPIIEYWNSLFSSSLLTVENNCPIHMLMSCYSSAFSQ